MVRRVIPVALAVVVLLAVPVPAYAAGGHVSLVSAGILGSIFGTIGHALLGAFNWTIGLAAKFVLTTIAALVKLLIPHSWVTKGLQIMEWIVAVPDYAGKITTPSGLHEYGFAGINALRDLFTWLGIAVVPLSLTYATGRAMVGEYEPVGIPVLRVVAVAVMIAAYPYWWSQAAALTDQVTHAILTLPDVTRGLYKLMQYAVDGVALGGWQLIDLGLMGAIGLELLALIFLKVVLILLGALLYAVGPLMIGLVPTRAGGALARAWCSAVVLLFVLGIGWAALFAVGALLIADAGTAGPLIAGNSTFGSLVGGLLLALAGLASLWLCLKAAREAGGLLRLQLAGLLALGHSRPGGATGMAGARARTTGRSLRDYGARLARASTAAGGELAMALPGGGALAGAGRTAGYVGRRGLLGTAAAGAGLGARRAAGPTEAFLGRSRAGAVAVRMARAGTASWNRAQPAGARRERHTANLPRQQAASGRNGRVTYSPELPSDRLARPGAPRPATRSQTLTHIDRAASGTPNPPRRRAAPPDAGAPGSGPSARPIAAPNGPPGRTSTPTQPSAPSGRRPSPAPPVSRPSAGPPPAPRRKVRPPRKASRKDKP